MSAAALADTPLGRPRIALWIVAGALVALSLAAPLALGPEVPAREFPLPPIVLAAAFIAIGVAGSLAPRRIGLMAVLVLLGCVAALATVHRPEVAGAAGLGLWLQVAGLWLAAWLTIDAMAAVELLDQRRQRLLDLAVAAAFGAFLLFLWEVATVGFGVPAVLMPSPSAVGARFAGSLPTLWADFVQTFVKAVLAGWAMGCGAGFLVATLADRMPFLRARTAAAAAISWRRCRSSASHPSWSCGSASTGSPRPPSWW